MLSKTLYNLHIYIDADYKRNITFHACVCILRLQVLICNANTSLQRIVNRF